MSTRRALGFVALMLPISGASQAYMIIDPVTVGNPGNASDTRYGTPGIEVKRLGA